MLRLLGIPREEEADTLFCPGCSQIKWFRGALWLGVLTYTGEGHFTAPKV